MISLGVRLTRPGGAIAGEYVPPGGPSIDLADLLAYYTLDEVSGNRADSHTNGLTLTDNGTVASAAGKIGLASLHDGTGAESLSSTDAAFARTTSHTWAFWVKVATGSLATADAAAGRGIFSIHRNDAIGDVMCGVTPTGAFAYGHWRTTPGADATGLHKTAAAVIAEDTWYHIAIRGTLSAGPTWAYDLRVDGAAVAFATHGSTDFAWGNTGFRLGYNYSSGGSYAHSGLIDELAVVDRLWTDEECDAHLALTAFPWGN